MKRLFIDEIDNMRDLGGYITKEGKVIKNFCLVRSNLPKNLSKKSIDKLVNKKITTIIDLRSEEEISKEPGIFFDSKFFNCHYVKIKGDGRLPDTPKKVFDSYVEMIEGKEAIGKIFSIIANSTHGVLYYCNAGKDRTGVVSALILKLLGVDDKDIILDYIASGIYLKEMLDEFASSINISNINDIIIPKQETMFRVLEYIEERYNTIEEYLYFCGVKEDELKYIKAKNLETIIDNC